MMSIYDLVYEYMDIAYEDEKLSGKDKRTIHQEITKILKRGWCVEDILKVFKSSKSQTLQVSRLFTGKKKKLQNLLEPNRFYHHNNLRLTSAPPKRELDYDSGEIKVINEPYFLEIKASYTVSDLTIYYARQVNQSLTKDKKVRYEGSFNWLLKSFDVEQILFMIDATANYCTAEDQPLPHTPLKIQDFYQEGKMMFDNKKTEAVIARSDKIVRKKRLR